MFVKADGTSERFASLGMYDGGDLTEANDVLWSAVAERLQNVEGVPSSLDRELSLMDLWRSDRLLFGQTCGYPFARHLRETLATVGVPVYDTFGCTETTHRSLIVVGASSKIFRLEQLRSTRVVINDVDSNTGRQLFGDAVADVWTRPGPFFESIRVSGSHARSLRAVADGEADAASIDCVTYAHQERLSPDVVARIRILHVTRETPSLPFVISARLGEDVRGSVTKALAEAMTDPRTERARKTLRLIGVRPVEASVYDRTLGFAARANRIFGGTPVMSPVAA